MKFSHYTAKPLIEQQPPQVPKDYARFKRPTGLWLSIDSPEDWPVFCRLKNWHLDRLALRYVIQLQPEANLLWLETDEDISTFSRRYGMTALNQSAGGRTYYLNWPRLRNEVLGVIFSADAFRTCSHPNDGLSWIAGWDIRSACIWSPEAIVKRELDPAWPQGMPD